jgi:phthiocerol/phenolphthiocerol synthesis type-I polyketide synthase B
VTLESGLEPMPDEVAIQALWALTGPDAPARSTIVAADWIRLATAYRTRTPLHIVDHLLPTDANEPDTDSGTSSVRTTEFREALRASEPTGRRDLLFDHISALVAKVMALPSSQSLDPSAGFFQFGMDSLMSVTLQRALVETLGEALPASVVFDYPTVESLVGYLATILSEMIEVADYESVDDTFDELTEAELLQQLSERLS